MYVFGVDFFVLWLVGRGFCFSFVLVGFVLFVVCGSWGVFCVCYKLPLSEMKETVRAQSNSIA